MGGVIAPPMQTQPSSPLQLPHPSPSLTVGQPISVVGVMAPHPSDPKPLAQKQSL
jgi:hypothetical protein